MDRDAVLEKFLNNKEVYEVLNLLGVVLGLIRRYWRKLTTQSFMKGIEKIFSNFQ